MRLKEARDCLQEAIGSPILRCENFEGSSSSLCFRVLAEDYKPLFCKIDESANGSLLAEADGLSAIQATQTVRVPAIITASNLILVTEAIENKMPGLGFGKRLAEALHRLHQIKGPIGWHRDNFIGRSPQRNIGVPNGSWAEFFWEKRLRVQFDALADRDFFPDDSQWLPRLKELVLYYLDSVKEPTSLLHGDLWNGNVLCDEEDDPVLIDPAIYFGHREADIAMTHIFGGFTREFYTTYEKLWPYEEGHEKRGKIYQLYHLLNHAQLFGLSYWRQAWDVVNDLLAAEKRNFGARTVETPVRRPESR